MAESFYTAYIVTLTIAFLASLGYRWMKRGGAGSSTDGSNSPTFAAFQRQFLTVYLIMMAADWMQGPYVYRLYEHYGFTREDNGVLFIAGFGSSLVFGTWAGPMADKYGRKLNCILYGVTYILSCMTKHFPNFKILMVGRLLGGFATSILWSAFESWMVSEHLSRFDAGWVGGTFSYMHTFNGIVAILSGFVAQWSVDFFEHPVAPFDMSALFLLIGSGFIWFSWSENYGDTKNNMLQQMNEAIRVVRTNKSVFFVGLSQSLFEGAMYTFVFMWTPALSGEGSERKDIPHGLIFASFMIACSLGGSLFGILEKRWPLPVLARNLFIFSAGTMAVPMLTDSGAMIMAAFLGFEVAVGLFWPCIGTLRSKYVPEDCRATVTNLFRVPLNLVVCVVLYYQGGMTVANVFTFCTVFHLMAAVSAFLLSQTIGDQSASESASIH